MNDLVCWHAPRGLLGLIVLEPSILDAFIVGQGRIRGWLARGEGALSLPNLCKLVFGLWHIEGKDAPQPEIGRLARQLVEVARIAGGQQIDKLPAIGCVELPSASARYSSNSGRPSKALIPFAIEDEIMRHQEDAFIVLRGIAKGTFEEVRLAADDAVRRLQE